MQPESARCRVKSRLVVQRIKRIDPTAPKAQEPSAAPSLPRDMPRICELPELPGDDDQAGGEVFPGDPVE